MQTKLVEVCGGMNSVSGLMGVTCRQNWWRCVGE